MIYRLFGLVCLFSLTAVPAFAHTGHHHGAWSFASGFFHPFSGLDHLAAMIAIGVIAYKMGARIITPVTFLGTMGIGALASGAIVIPFAEWGIIATSALMVLFSFSRINIGSVLLFGTIALAGLLHGYAHGQEIPHAANAIVYGLGFLVATSLLHAFGFVAALLVRQGAGMPMLRKQPR